MALVDPDVVAGLERQDHRGARRQHAVEFSEHRRKGLVRHVDN
jgi:hypothetical protein